jgi:hypothetical protein
MKELIPALLPIAKILEMQVQEWFEIAHKNQWERGSAASDLFGLQKLQWQE